MITLKTLSKILDAFADKQAANIDSFEVCVDPDKELALRTHNQSFAIYFTPMGFTARVHLMMDPNKKNEVIQIKLFNPGGLFSYGYRALKKMIDKKTNHLKELEFIKVMNHVNGLVDISQRDFESQILKGKQ